MGNLGDQYHGEMRRGVYHGNGLIPGQMEKSMSVNGTMGRCVGMVSIHTPMGTNMRVNIRTTKDTVGEQTSGFLAQVIWRVSRRKKTWERHLFKVKW